MDPVVSELDVESLVIAWAEDHGWLCAKLQWIGQTGWPDRTFIKNGKVVFVEFKRPKGGVRAPKQLHWHRQLRKHGATAVFISTVEEGIELLKTFDD